MVSFFSQGLVHGDIQRERLRPPRRQQPAVEARREAGGQRHRRQRGVRQELVGAERYEAFDDPRTDAEGREEPNLRRDGDERAQLPLAHDLPHHRRVEGFR